MANHPAYDPGGSGRTRGARESRSRALLALIVALAAGLGAAWLVTRTLASRTQKVVSVPMKKLVVAKDSIGMAQALTDDRLDIVEWPETSVPPAAIQDKALLVGRVTRSEFIAGEPIVEARLAPKGAGTGLSAAIPKGKRAMTVKVSESSGVAGFIHPGDTVDVIATMQLQFPKVEQPELTSRVVLQRIKVIAVGEELAAQNAKPIKVPVVTLLVTSEESEKLALASSHGELSLTMRASDDEEPAVTAGITPQLLMVDPALLARIAEVGKMGEPSKGGGGGGGNYRPQPTPVATSQADKPRSQTVEIYKGTTNSTTKTFDTSQGN